MSIIEIFEKYQPKELAEKIGIPSFIVLPEDVEENSSEFLSKSLERFLDVLLDRVTTESVFNDMIQRGRYQEALKALGEIEDRIRSTFISYFIEAIQKDSGLLDGRLQNIGVRIRILEKSEYFQNDPEFRKDIEDYQLMFDDIRSRKSDDPITADFGIAAVFERYREDVADIEEFLEQLEQRANFFRREKIDDGFRLFNLIAGMLRSRYQDRKTDADFKHIDKVFMALPRFILIGNLKEMCKVEEILRLGQDDRLAEIEVPLGTQAVSHSDAIRNLERLSMLRGAAIKHQTELRGIARQYFSAIPALAIKERDPEVVKESIRQKTRSALSYADAGNVLVGGAKSLLALGVQDVQEWLSKGFVELGKHSLLSRKYIHAQELFGEAFRVSFRLPLGEDPRTIQNATLGMIIAEWLPKYLPNKAVEDSGQFIEGAFAAPGLLLERLPKRHFVDSLFPAFDVLSECSEMVEFLTVAQSLFPEVDCFAVLVDKVLMPTYLYRKTGKSGKQLQALSDYLGISLLHDVVSAFQRVVDSLGGSDASLRADIEKLDRSIRGAESSFDNLEQMEDRESARTVLEGLREIIRSVKDHEHFSDELLISVRPVNTIYYLDEKYLGLELILLVSLSKNSAPSRSLSLEVRVDPRRTLEGDFIRFKNFRQDIGVVGAGDCMEAVISMDIQPEILQRYDEIGVETNIFEADKAIQPTDGKRNFKIFLRKTRRGGLQNPYNPGPALQKNSLYVGRERELELLKTTLMGKSQDNIPLIIGMRRIGKTSLLNRLMYDDDIRRRYVCIFYDLQDMAETETTGTFLKKICVEIHRECGEKWKVPFTREAFQNDPAEAFERYTKDLAASGSKMRVLVVFDEFEKLILNLEKWKRRLEAENKAGDPRTALTLEVLATLRKAMIHSDKISFVISGTPLIESVLRDYHSRFFSMTKKILLKPFDYDETRKLIQHHSLPYEVSEEAVFEVVYMSGKMPYLIQLIGSSLFDRMVHSGRHHAGLIDVEMVIQDDILPNSEYFGDYRDLIEKDREVIFAVAMAHKNTGRHRQYVSFDTILNIVNRDNSVMRREDLVLRLNELQKSERPLIERNPNRSDSFRLFIGLLSLKLEEEIDA